jgi:hypothetical protein
MSQSSVITSDRWPRFSDICITFASDHFISNQKYFLSEALQTPPGTVIVGRLENLARV